LRRPCGQQAVQFPRVPDKHLFQVPTWG